METTHQQYLTHRLSTTVSSGVSYTAVTGAKFVAVFKSHMFYAGMSSNKQEAGI